MLTQDVAVFAYCCAISAISIMTYDEAKLELGIIVLSAVFFKSTRGFLPVFFFYEKFWLAAF
jgi:hypothetical protein